MRILMVTPEANPFARSGGLAEVISALSHSLVRRGHHVAVVLPLYRQVRESGHPLTFTGKSLPIPLSLKTLTADIYETRLPSGVHFYFIGQDALYNREGLYGTAYGDFEDNAERFIFFSRAVVEMVEALELELDVCHCHEWQSGLVPVYCRTLYRERPRLQRLPIVYTVHNVGFQGIFSAFDLPLTGLGWELLSPKALEFFGRINLMKGGLVFADLLSTVSHKYREEILTPEQGFGLEGVFQERAQDLFGIVVGVDYERWDPARDPFLPASYSPEDLSGKERCKEALLKHFGLTLPLETPLFGLTTRLYERKGIDLLEAILEELFRLEVGLVLQGTGEERHQYILQEQALKFSGRFGLHVDYSEALAHQIIAGADIFLMPSRYEPCGLDQLYCLRYGTIPVVRATGGLDETIQAYNPETGEGTGFKFHDYTPEAFLEAIRQALALYADRPAWQALMRRNMALDFSWDRVAPQYEDLYRLAQDKRRQAVGG